MCKGPIFIPSDHRLRQPATVQRLARATKRLRLARRAIPDWIADTVFGFEGEIRTLQGAVFTLDDEEIDRVFRDGSFRWLSEFLRATDHPPKQRAQLRVVPKLRLIAIAHLIANRD